jgi:ribonucleoside-diphosphate reductase alpha chain
MYDLGCKGGTIYRDGSRDEQVLNLKAEASAEAEAKEESAGNKKVGKEVKARVRPTILHGNTYRKHTPVGTAYITINANGDGDKAPFEVFINVAKVGSDVAADAESLGRLISLILRMPSPHTPYERAQDVIAQLRGIGSGQQRGFGKQRVMSLADAVAQALAEHIGFHPNADLPGLPDEEDEESGYNLSFPPPKGDICPSCGNAALMLIEGCKKCYSCGFSQC